MKTAPFKFGEIVTGSHFTNREDEILRLQQNFRSLQNTIIISPRRYGKSSLVKESVERFAGKEKGYYFCFIDLMYVYSEEEFYNQFATQVLKASSNKLEEFFQLAVKMLKGARVTVNAGTGEPGLELGINFMKDQIESILNLPQSIATRKRRKVIVCLDEFQNISRFDSKQNLQGRLRSVWQHHQQAGYVIYGSKQSMMTEIFNKSNSPFYKFGELIYLNRIDTERLKEYLQHSFRSTGKEISDEICIKIINTIENHPYYLQQFARNIWLIAGKKVTISDFEKALQALKTENLNYYTQILDDLSGYQASFLRALLNNEESLYSSDVISGYKLGSSANVRRMFQSFVKRGIIVKDSDEIVFTDPIFKLLARERFANGIPTS